MEWFYYEHMARRESAGLICGIDEAGRGPLAGPVFAAAVILPDDLEIAGINDSKKLSAKKREALFEVITKKAIDYFVAQASEAEIDTYNILNATYLAMKRAVEGLKTKPDFALVDGNRDPVLGIPTTCIVGGDGKSASIAAASILAKVSRDRYMEELDRKCPQYLFAKHKGYPTKLHYEKILQYGVSEYHRMSFLKNLAEKRLSFEQK
ncbi:MAG TPA: ribonuclease HII [Clostridia bacterium]|nr:ribonuclease HII [Clostridia bacterium]